MLDYLELTPRSVLIALDEPLTCKRRKLNFNPNKPVLMNPVNIDFPMFKKSEFIMVHGKQFQYFNLDSQERKCVQSENVTGFSSIVYLGHPYIKSFVHETIVLKKKELADADLHVLPFVKSSERQVSVTSIQISAEKALTIHNHISHQGQKYIEENNIKKWKPLIPDLILRLRNCYPEVFPDASGVVLKADREILLTRFHPDFTSCYLPIPDQIKSEVAVNKLLDHSTSSFFGKNRPLKSRLAPAKININQLDNESNQDFYNIFSKKKLFWKRNISVLPFQTLQKKFIRFFNPVILLVFLLLAFSGWSFYNYEKVIDLKTEKQELSERLGALNNYFQQMAVFSKDESVYFRLLALKKALNQFSQNPEEKIQMFNRLLPVTIWITRFQLNREFIEIEVLDSRQNEVTRLLDLIDSKVGPSRLILNEYIVIDEKKLNRMVIRISNAKND